MSIYDDPAYSEFLKGFNPPPTSDEPKKAPKGSYGGDLVASFGSGAGNLVQGVGTFFGGSDSAVADIGATAQEYWNERKSEKLRAKEAELGRKMRDKDTGILETIGSVIADPYLASSMLAGSAPTMAVGMGAGGLVARGMASAGLMVGESGALTSLGARTAGGIGEGLTIAPDAYTSTQGSGAAAAGGLALGVVTNLVTPGNLASSAARKMGGGVVDDTVANAFNRTVARRAGTAMLAEGAQEFGQEGGQAAIEQLGRGEALDLQSIAKQGGVGAVLGAVMGGGLHPVVGEGAPRYQTVEERDAAVRAKAEADALDDNITAAQAASDAVPTDPVAKAKLEALQASKNVNLTSEIARVNPNEQTAKQHELAKDQLAVATATLAAAEDPTNREAFDTAETMRAELALKIAGPQGVKQAADVALQAGLGSIAAAPDFKNAIAAFGATDQASSTLRITVPAIQNTRAGVQQGAQDAVIEAAQGEADRVDGVNSLARAEIETEHQATLRKEREAKAAHQTAQAALKVDQERQKLGFPPLNVEVPTATGVPVETTAGPQAPQYTVAMSSDGNTAHVFDNTGQIVDSYTGKNAKHDASLTAGLWNSAEEITATEVAEPTVTEVAEPTAFNTAPQSHYTISASPDEQIVDVVDSDGEIFDTYRGNGAMQDARRTADHLNRREVGQPTPTNRDAALAQGDSIDQISYPAIDQISYPATAQRTTSTLAEATTRFREIARQNGQSASNTDSAIRGLNIVANSGTQVAEKAIQNYEDDNNHSSAELLRAMLDERDTAHAEASPLVQAAADMLADGYSQVAVDEVVNSTDAQLQNTMNDIGAKRTKRTLAFEILADRSFDTGMSRRQFDAREDALNRELAIAAPLFNRTEQEIATNLDSRPLPYLVELANGTTRPADHPNVQASLARMGVAYKTNSHMGNVDNHIPARTATPTRTTPTRTTTAPATAPAPTNTAGQRQVESDFKTRAEAALANGVLKKLGEFWTTVMAGRGQRVFNVNTSSLTNVARNFRELTQPQLNSLVDIYNDELNRQAQAWGKANNQPVTSLVNPVVSIGKIGSSIVIKVHSLGRNEQNPYMVPADDPNVGTATVSMSDGHMTTVDLEAAKGSSNLAYRLAAELGNMANETVPSSGSLLTNNRMRRHMQAVYIDSLFGPGRLSPMGVSGEQTPHGVPPDVWRNSSRTEKIGLNILRAAHQITENRSSSKTIARFLENLQYNRQGEIVAVTEPVHRRGFPKGTKVTDEMLLAKLREADPDFNNENGTAGATALGRTYAGGVGPDTAKLGILTNTILARIESDPTKTIPQSWATQAKQIGREMGGWMFSEAEQEGKAKGVTYDEAVDRVREMIGRNVAGILLDTGMIDFVQTGEELTGETFSDANGKVQGATMPDGKIVLVLDNLSAETFDGVLAHEAIHSTLKTLIGEDTYNVLMSRLDTMLKAGGDKAKWVQEARARIPANTNPDDVLEEIAGYAVEQSVRGGVGTRGNPLIQWAKDFMSALRAGIIANKNLPKSLREWATKNIQPQDLTRLAIAGLKRSAAGERAQQARSEAPRDYAREIEAKLAEHRAEGTTGDRRSALNREIAQLRTAQRVQGDTDYEQSRAPRLSVAQQQQVDDTLNQVSPTPANEINVLDRGRRTGVGRILEKFGEMLVDSHITLDRIQRLAKVTLEHTKLDTMGALHRFGSRVMDQQKKLVNQPMARIESILSKEFKAEDARKAIDDLLIARHAAEYNAAVSEINPAKYDANGRRTEGYDAANPASGITDEEAAATIQRLTGTDDAKSRALLAAEKEYRKMITDLQDFSVERGLVSRELVDNWNKKYPNYTPFLRQHDTSEAGGIGTMPGSQGFSLRSGISRQAMGSSRDIVSPTAATTAFGIRTVRRGESAKVAQTFLEFAKNFVPNYLNNAGDLKPMWEVNQVPQGRVIKRVNVYTVTKADGSTSNEFYNREDARNYADAQQQEWVRNNPNEPVTDSPVDVVRPYNEAQRRVFVEPKPNYLNDPNVMVIPVNGENAIITFDKESPDAMRILEAFKGEKGSIEKNALLVIPRMFSRWVMATSTGFNPVFSVFNGIRDVEAVAISSGADKVPGWSGKNTMRILKESVPAGYQIMKQAGAEFRQLHGGKEAPVPEEGSINWFKNLMIASGGATGISHSINDMESAETEMRRLYGQEELDRGKPAWEPKSWLDTLNRKFTQFGDVAARFAEGETKGNVLGKMLSQRVVSATARMNEAAELATRTLVFREAYNQYLDNGSTAEEAAQKAAVISKNASTNFNRRGTWSNNLNALFPFFNAAAQGTKRLGDVLFEKKTYSIDVNGKLMLTEKTRLSPYGQKVVGNLVALGMAQAAILAMAGYDDDDIPQQTKDRAFIIPLPNGGYYAQPMPHGFNLLLNFGREAAQAVGSAFDGEFKKAANHFGEATFGQLKALNPMGSAGNTLSDILPAALDPFASLYMNKDAFGRPIAKEDINSTMPTPGYKRSKEGASESSKKIAEWINLIGGDEDRKGMFSPTADQIDFAFQQIGGGVGREILKTGQVIGGLAKDALDIERERLPLYKVPMVGRLLGDTQEPVVINAKVHTVTTELNTLNARYKGLMERGEKEEAKAFKEEHPELSLQDDFAKFGRGGSKAKKVRITARGEGDIETVNVTVKKQDDRARELLEKYKELTEK